MLLPCLSERLFDREHAIFENKELPCKDDSALSCVEIFTQSATQHAYATIRSQATWSCCGLGALAPTSLAAQDCQP